MSHKSQLLIAAVYSGLGNRMRVLLSARSFAESEGMSFQYFWQIDHRFQARIDDLWEFDAKRIGLARFAMAAARYGANDGKTLASGVKTQKVQVVRDQQPIPDRNGSSTGWKDSMNQLIPSPPIRERVRRIWSEELKGEPYIAVMVRAHQQSHQVTKDTSPPSWFIERMLEISRAHPDMRFFLSCDHPETQRGIMLQVPNVVAQNKTSRYNSREGVVDAVVDLYLAGLGSHIIGPHWSSFVDMAEALNPNQREAETPVRPAASPLDLRSLLTNGSQAHGIYPWLTGE